VRSTTFQQRQAKAIMDQGIYQTRQILRKADRDAVNALDKANREAAKPTIEKAKDITPDVALSQWSKYGWSRRGSGLGELNWDKSKIMRGYKFLAGKKSNFTGVRTLLRFANTSAAGGMFEIAGRGKSQGTSPQGKAMVRTLNRKFPNPSRLLWKAVDEVGNEELRERIIQNYNDLIDKYNAQIDAYSYVSSSKVRRLQRFGK
jgi:hypothetical protein